jgi:hypothetical protein
MVVNANEARIQGESRSHYWQRYGFSDIVKFVDNAQYGITINFSGYTIRDGNDSLGAGSRIRSQRNRRQAHVAYLALKKAGLSGRANTAKIKAALALLQKALTSTGSAFSSKEVITLLRTKGISLNDLVNLATGPNAKKGDELIAALLQKAGVNPNEYKKEVVKKRKALTVAITAYRNLPSTTKGRVYVARAAAVGIALQALISFLQTPAKFSININLVTTGRQILQSEVTRATTARVKQAAQAASRARTNTFVRGIRNANFETLYNIVTHQQTRGIAFTFFGQKYTKAQLVQLIKDYSHAISKRLAKLLRQNPNASGIDSTRLLALKKYILPHLLQNQQLVEFTLNGRNQLAIIEKTTGGKWKFVTKKPDKLYFEGNSSTIKIDVAWRRDPVLTYRVVIQGQKLPEVRVAAGGSPLQIGFVDSSRDGIRQKGEQQYFIIGNRRIAINPRSKLNKFFNNGFSVGRPDGDNNTTRGEYTYGVRHITRWAQNRGYTLLEAIEIWNDPETEFEDRNERNITLARTQVEERITTYLKKKGLSPTIANIKAAALASGFNSLAVKEGIRLMSILGTASITRFAALMMRVAECGRAKRSSFGVNYETLGSRAFVGDYSNPENIIAYLTGRQQTPATGRNTPRTANSGNRPYTLTAADIRELNAMIKRDLTDNDSLELSNVSNVRREVREFISRLTQDGDPRKLAMALRAIKLIPTLIRSAGEGNTATAMQDFIKSAGIYALLANGYRAAGNYGKAFHYAQKAGTSSQEMYGKILNALIGSVTASDYKLAVQIAKKLESGKELALLKIAVKLLKSTKQNERVLAARVLSEISPTHTFFMGEDQTGRVLSGLKELGINISKKITVRALKVMFGYNINTPPKLIKIEQLLSIGQLRDISAIDKAIALRESTTPEQAITAINSLEAFRTSTGNKYHRAYALHLKGLLMFSLARRMTSDDKKHTFKVGTADVTVNRKEIIIESMNALRHSYEICIGHADKNLYKNLVSKVTQRMVTIGDMLTQIRGNRAVRWATARFAKKVIRFLPKTDLISTRVFTLKQGRQAYTLLGYRTNKKFSVGVKGVGNTDEYDGFTSQLTPRSGAPVRRARTTGRRGRVRQPALSAAEKARRKAAAANKAALEKCKGLAPAAMLTCLKK